MLFEQPGSQDTQSTHSYYFLHLGQKHMYFRYLFFSVQTNFHP